MKIFVQILFLALILPTSLLARSIDHISVVYGQGIAPFEYTDKDGTANGLIIDYWKLWSKKTGITVDFIGAPWSQTLTMVKNGIADAHAGLFFSDKRNTYLEYGTILSNTDTDIFVHESITIPTDIKEFSAYRVGVIAKEGAI